jgi:hypothetical protein
MKAHWIERLRMWLCDKFGHLNLTGSLWKHNGYWHQDCKFCKRTYTYNKELDNEH